MRHKNLFLFLTCFALYSCFNPEDYDIGSKYSGSLKIMAIGSLDKSANNADYFELSATVSDEVAPEKRIIVLHTSNGSFEGGLGDSVTVDLGEKKSCLVKLKSVVADSAIVSGKISGIESSDTIRLLFKRAFPDIISVVSVDSFAIAGNFRSEILIVAKIRSGKGIPSLHCPVLFDVKKPSGEQLGDFINNTSTANTNENGSASIRFSPAISNYSGYVYISAKTRKFAGDSATASTRVFIK